MKAVYTLSRDRGEYEGVGGSGSAPRALSLAFLQYYCIHSPLHPTFGLLRAKTPISSREGVVL